jgi:hypothetical protein
MLEESDVSRPFFCMPGNATEYKITIPVKAPSPVNAPSSCRNNSRVDEIVMGPCGPGAVGFGVRTLEVDAIEKLFPFWKLYRLTPAKNE